MTNFLLLVFAVMGLLIGVLVTWLFTRRLHSAQLSAAVANAAASSATREAELRTQVEGAATRAL